MHLTLNEHDDDDDDDDDDDCCIKCPTVEHKTVYFNLFMPPSKL